MNSRVLLSVLSAPVAPRVEDFLISFFFLGLFWYEDICTFAKDCLWCLFYFCSSLFACSSFVCFFVWGLFLCFVLAWFGCLFVVLFPFLFTYCHVLFPVFFCLRPLLSFMCRHFCWFFVSKCKEKKALQDIWSINSRTHATSVVAQSTEPGIQLRSSILSINGGRGGGGEGGG